MHNIWQLVGVHFVYSPLWIKYTLVYVLVYCNVFHYHE